MFSKWWPLVADLVVVAGLAAGGGWFYLDQQKTNQARLVSLTNSFSEQMNTTNSTVKTLEETVLALKSVPPSTTVVSAPAKVVTEKPTPTAVAASPAATSTSRLININTATVEELDSLPGIGASYAARIVAARPFQSVDDLDRVAGVGSKTIEKLRSLVTAQ